MYEVNPKHKKNVHVENVVKVIYPRLLKALYGLMESAKLWYDIHSKTLKSHGFVVNPYYKCISNSTVKGKQCTISWCVDDDKSSHIVKN